MAKLADQIAVEGRFARSANLERDVARSEPLDGYIVTARALDVIEPIAAAAATGPAGGAWSLTGPYGSGKSSLALLLDAALGGAGTARQVALKLIDDASPTVGELTRQTHQRHRTEESGFHRGLVTAGREPLNHTVFRA
jgi:pantothenate kinase-related protein Tda10